ncbi:hypothetical protein M5D96_001197, partial [Drosophila gunungcola]
MHFDWQSWRMLMEEPLAEEQIDEIRDMLTHIPTKGEFMNSIKGAIDFQSGENPNSQTNREDLKLKALIDMATYHIQHESDNMSIVSSPVGSFSLIRHMQSDWTHWQLFLQEDPGKDEMESLISKNSYLPTKEDISEVCKNISSIIKAYDLHPQDFARRFLSGVQLNSMLSPRDCLQLADHSITNKDFNMSVQWLQVAISMLDNHSNQDRIHPLFHLNTADLYLKLAEVYVKQSLWPLALQTLDTALKSQPWNAKLLTMQEHLSSQILLDPPSSPDLSIRSNQYKLQGNRRLYCFYQRKKEYPFLL